MIMTGLMIVFLLFFFKFRVDLDKPPILAKIGEEEINYKDYLAFVVPSQRKELSDNEKKLALDYLVSQKVVYVYAKKSGLVDSILTKEFQKELQYRKKDFLVKKFYTEQVDNKVKITNKIEREYYNTHNYLTLYNIGISRKNKEAKQRILKAKKALDNYKEFNLVSKLYNDKKFKNNDGLLGYYEVDDLPSPFKEQALLLDSSGQYSDIFEADYGYFILYRGEKPSFKEIEFNVNVKCVNLEKKRLMKELIEKIKSKIIINEDIFERLPYLDKNTLLCGKFDYEIIYNIEGNKQPLKFPEFYKTVKDLFFLDDYIGKTSKQMKDIAYQLAVQDYILSQVKALKLDTRNDTESQWKKEKRKLKSEHNEKIVKYIFENHAKKDIQVSEKEILDYYEKHKDTYVTPTLYKLQRLVVNSKNTANKLYELIQGGYNFSELVLNYSIEKGVKNTIGRTTFLTKNDLSNEFSIIKNYALNECSKPIKIDNQYIIIKILDKQAGAFKSLNMVRNEIHTRLQVDKIDKWLEDKKEKYNIVVEKYYDNLLEVTSKELKTWQNNN